MNSSFHISVQRRQITQHWIVFGPLLSNSKINYFEVRPIDRHLGMHAPRCLLWTLVVIFVISDIKLLKIWLLIARCITILKSGSAILTTILDCTLQITLLISSRHISVQWRQITQNLIVDRPVHSNSNINYFEVHHIDRHLEIARFQMIMVCSSGYFRVQRYQISQNWIVDHPLRSNSNMYYFEAPPYWPPSWIA